MTARHLADTITGTLVLGCVLAAVWTLARLPFGQPIPVHFDAGGQPNGWAPAGVALFIMPAVGATMWILRVLLPRITPRGDNLDRSAGAYGTIWIASTIFVALGQGLIIAGALGYRINISALVPALVGGLFIVIGNVLPKLRWNYVVGIRTPWTLADERVWDKTHRFGGWTMVLGGLVLLIGALVPPYAPKPGLVAGVTGLVAMLTIGKSYLLWRDRSAPNAS